MLITSLHKTAKEPLKTLFYTFGSALFAGTIKVYLCYTTIFDIKISRFFFFSFFLRNPQTSRSVTPSWALLHNGSYTYAYFFES